ncbi:MAG: transporter [Hydrogenophilaceae bacterium]|nr:transporter [Hydrogenophilaceae bacterium]
MKRSAPILLLSALATAPALAHHGVASLGAAGLEGPGAPVETSSSATLPQGKWLAYLKVDHAESKQGILPPPENDYNQYWMLGLGYGFRPWLSAYLFQPYNIKQDTPGGFESRGFTDLSVMGVVGFKYDDGLMRVPANESLDDLMDWHFTFYGGLSLPTGDANHRLPDTSIDPGMALGFGKSSFSYGVTATKQLDDKATLVLEAGQIRFQEYHYDPDPVGGNPAGIRVQFGTETRVNGALSYRLITHPESRFRLDGNVELNFLRLGRDVEDGIPATATGGDILYGVVGARVYKDNLSLGLALKKPVWTDLNEESQQQGAEGKEQYRFIVTFSALF